jgi:hypothetical protein
MNLSKAQFNVTLVNCCNPFQFVINTNKNLTACFLFDILHFSLQINTKGIDKRINQRVNGLKRTDGGARSVIKLSEWHFLSCN